MKILKCNIPIFILFLLLIIPLFNLLHSGLPVTHDGQDHVARIANFYQNLKEGIIVPRWAQNLNWGYGHPILMFLYPLPSYISSLFHFFGMSLVDSFKAVMVLGFITGGFAMYIWLQSFLDIPAAFTGAMLYSFAPYRFVDLYVRGDIGEHVAFIFPPLICYFLLRVRKNLSIFSLLGISVGSAGLILAHNAMALLFLPLIFLYWLFLVFQEKNPKIFISRSVIGILLGFGLAAFFWIPAFFEGKYTLRDIVTKGDILSNFVTLSALIYGPWSYGGSGQFTVQVGIAQWIAVISSVCIFFVKKVNKFRTFIVIAILIFVLTLFLMTSSSYFVWQHISILQKFQFPWRLLAISVFITSVLGGIVVWVLPQKFKIISVLLSVVLLLVFSKDYWHAKTYSQKSESFYTGIYNGTTDTGESAPIWSVRFMEQSPKAHIETISGDATYTEKSRLVAKHEYIANAANTSQVRENTLYFPGWQVYVNNSSVPIEFQDPKNRGVITFYVPQGTHTITMLFQETKLRLIADTISILAFLILIFIYLWRKDTL